MRRRVYVFRHEWCDPGAERVVMMVVPVRVAGRIVGTQVVPAKRQAGTLKVRWVPIPERQR